MSYCGLVCETCPIYLATREEDREEQARMRAEIVRICREQYQMNYAPEEITDCDGCGTEGGRIFSACNDCSVRLCAREKKLKNCAYCSEYACGELEAFFAKEPSARKRLDEVRRTISDHR